MIYPCHMTARFFCFFSFAFLSIFVCATSGANVNDIRRIDFKHFRYPWDAIAITSHMPIRELALACDFGDSSLHFL
jgi:hypothetical protein